MKKDKAVRKQELKAALIKQVKSLIGPTILCLMIVAAGLAIALWRGEKEPVEIIKVNGYDGSEEVMVLENDNVKFEFDPMTTQFSLTTKKNGQVWYSNPQDVENDTKAMKREKGKLNSTLLLTYSTINGVDALYDNYSFGIEGKTYQIEQGEDYIKILYSIGDIEKEYVIPAVMEDSRMKEFLGKLSKEDQIMVSDYYKKYDINKLGKKDNKEELLARYPLMETEVIHALRDTTTETVKKKLQKIFEDNGYTYEEYLADKEKDKAIKTSEKPVFNLSMIYRLDGDDLVVEIPFDDIEYKEEYPIYYLSILPYFGAAGTEEEGFMLVPEGGGALINYNNGKLNQNSYYANMYGWDMAQDRDAVIHETRASFNVFGAAKEDASFICILEEGAPYASIQADISGRSNSYNYVNAVYTLVHREQYDISDKYNGNMFVYEPNLPKGESLIQRYHFVDSGSYVDMAKSYQGYLVENYGDYFKENEDTQAPVAIEIVNAVDKVKQVMGIPLSRPLELTSYTETQAIIEELYGAGMENMSVKLLGWMNGGVQQKILNKVKLIRDLGSEKEFESMLGKAKELGVDVYLDGVTAYAYESDLFDGFFVYTDAARFVSKEKAELYEYSTITYGKRDDQEAFYLLRYNIVLEMMDNLLASADSYGAGVSFRDIGSELSSDFYRKELISRQASMEGQISKLAQVYENGSNIMVNAGNDYAVPYSYLITNMDLRGSEYSIIDEKVPFYQLALHGYVNYTGEAINLAPNGTDELLKSAEYGAGLSFSLMDESAFTLQNTFYTQYYGADYSVWADRALEIYTRYNKELGHVFNQQMTDHEYLSDSVSCTTYEDGTKVYVNYAYEDWTTDEGVCVPSKDYVVVR